MSEIQAAELTMIEYIDLAQYQNVSTVDFLSDKTNTICTLTIVGWALDIVIDGVHMIKIIYINDDDGNENSEGMVIPTSCIKRRVLLEPSEEVDTMDLTEDLN